jgi:lysine 2,3-aminomutase
MKLDFCDWKWQLSNLVTEAKELHKYIELSDEEEKEINDVCNTYPMAITPYYLKLMKPKDPNCPIRKQAIPSIEETAKEFNEEVKKRINAKDSCDWNDPLLEKSSSPVSNLIYKYKGKVVIIASNNCFTYCRHCERKNTVITSYDGYLCNEKLDNIISFLKKMPNINDVLISGGDPLFYSTEYLEKIISSIRKVSRISTIRIRTRALVTLPMRITDELVEMLQKYRPIIISTQFNHPLEITSYTKRACDLLSNYGIHMLNQTVLLKGVNDDEIILKKLMLKLVRNNVFPYYLHRCTCVNGGLHFITPFKQGVEIIRYLRKEGIPGFAIPDYAIDVPGKGNKIIIEPNNILSIKENYVELINYNKKD